MSRLPRRRPYAGPWPRVRKAILQRDGYTCQIRGPGCEGKATHVDHIVPVLSGGDWYDTENLRAACAVCNRRRVRQGVSNAWQNGGTYISLVVGPPGADLLTYVRTHAQPSDLVVDHGSLARSLGSDSAATKARNGLLDRLRLGQISEPRAWITSHNPNAETMFPHHRVVGVGADGTAWQQQRQGVTADAAAPSRPW